MAGCIDWLGILPRVTVDKDLSSVSFGCHLLHMFVLGEVVGQHHAQVLA